MSGVEQDTKPAIPFWASVAADIRAQVPEQSRPKTIAGWFPLAARVALISAGFRAVLNYRVAHAARTRWGVVGKPISRACFWFGRHWYGCSIASSARLHGGLVLPHPQGIVVGSDSVVGPNSWIFQNVTLGGVSKKTGMPQVGSGARLFAGAVLVGPVIVGDDVVVGPNAVVSQNVPSGSLVRSSKPTITP